MPEILKVDNMGVAEPAFRTLAYLDGDLGDERVIAGVTRLVESFIDRFGDQVALLMVRDKGIPPKPRKFDDKSLRLARDWLARPEKTFASCLRMNRYPTEDMNAPRAPHFRVEQNHKLVSLEISVPDVAEGLVDFADGIADTLKTLPILSAAQGMGFYLPAALDSLVTRFPMTFARYKTAIEITLGGPLDGIRSKGSAFPYDKHPDVRPGIADIGWRTFVGAPFLDRLPHIEKVADTDGVKLERMENMAVLTAGPVPIWGDVNRGEDISCYRAVARALAPVRYPHDVAIRSLFGGRSADPDGPERISGYLNRYA
ncbi:MAG: hypothetical protein ACK5MQ_17605 [Pikeienuella sp.]